MDEKSFKPVTSFPLRLKLEQIYPGKVFTFHMRVQLVEDAEKAQQEFIALPDAEQKGEAFHKFDVAMIVALSTKLPEGFPDMYNGSEATIAQTIQAYFMPDDAERREGMKFLCRRVMAQYWKAVQPAEYL